MPRKTSNHSKSWADLLSEEMSKGEFTFPEGAKTLEEIQQELRLAKLPGGQRNTYRWLRQAIDDGKVQMIEGFIRRDLNGRKVRQVRYLIK